MNMPLRTLIAAGLLLGGLTQANAIPQLQLTSGSSTVTISDSDADGTVNFFGGLGTWSMNMSGGFSKPTLGSSNLPYIDLLSGNISSGYAPSTLTILLTDTDFDPISAATMLSAIGGTTDGSVSYKAYADASNTAFGMGTLLASFDTSTPGAFSASYGTPLSLANPFALTLMVTINHDGSRMQQMTSLDAYIKVPEPSSLLLVGAGLLVAGFVVRRRAHFAVAPR
jgi:hypothetical protein